MMLPTPVVVDNPHPNSKVNEQGRRYNQKAESSHSMGLSDLAHHMMLPTPTAIEGVKWTNTWNPNSQMGQSLSAMAGSGMLPTPNASDCFHQNKAGNHDLEKGYLRGVAVDMWEKGELDTADPTAKVSQGVAAGQTSRLSPLFTEEMMGFPFLWTALPFLSQSGAPKPSKPTATPSSPK